MVHLAHESSTPPPAPVLSDFAAEKPPRPTWTIRLIRLTFVILGLAAWFITQHLIGARHASTGTLPIESDGILSLLTPAHTYLAQHLAARNALLIASSLGIDVLGIFLLARAIFGPTIRPFLGLLILFALRQIMQATCVLPMPPDMIWPKAGPGFPSLLVTYGVSNDLFFSGHTALAVFGAVELARLSRRLIPIAIFLALFEILAVLALRAHWTMDVYAGLVTALLVAILAGWISPAVDRALGRWGNSKSSKA